MAGVTLSSIGELFKNAEEVMEWLATCARSVAHANLAVEWRSPLGFPICQPYSEMKPQMVSRAASSCAQCLLVAAGPCLSPARILAGAERFKLWSRQGL